MIRWIHATAWVSIGISGMALSTESKACTRFVYQGPNDHVVTARSMDWKTEMDSNLWIFPRGMERDGAMGSKSIKWKAKYGSVIASAYEVSTSDGMNEKGLVANLLWLAESEYPKPNPDKPQLSVSLWAQYVLDQFATVKEAVEHLKSEPFILRATEVPGKDLMATVHLSLSDASGDSAIIQYIDGKQVIHHDRKYVVMTNSPTYDKQLALNAYWEEIGGTVMLPGTNRSADRFARASFYLKAIPRQKDPDIALASVFGIIRNASVPYGITTPNEPNISSTRWRVVADQKRKVYVFESARAPNTFWVNFKDVDFSEKTGKAMKLDLGKGQTKVHSGNTAKEFKPAEPFEFLGA